MKTRSRAVVGLAVVLVSSSVSAAAPRLRSPRLAKGDVPTTVDGTNLSKASVVTRASAQARHAPIPIWCGAPPNSAGTPIVERVQFTCVALDDSIPDFSTVPAHTTLRVHTVRLAPLGSLGGPAHLVFSFGSRSLGFVHTSRTLDGEVRSPSRYTARPEFSMTSVTPLMILRQNESLVGGLTHTFPATSGIARPQAQVGNREGLREFSHEFSVWGELWED